jgi:hypothetical protein
MAGEDDEGLPRPRRREQEGGAAAVEEIERDRGCDHLRDRLLVEADGRHVDELERPPGEVVVGHARILPMRGIIGA